jgi:N,N-dimethylformamidase
MGNVIGYADRFSAKPGDNVRFMISSPHDAALEVTFVRIINGDLNPEGPGYKEVKLACDRNGSYPGKVQEIYTGSGVIVPDKPDLSGLSSFHVQAMVWPTLPLRGEQSILAKWHSSNGGFAVMIDASGALALRLGDGRETASISTGVPMDSNVWYRVDAWFDAGTANAGVSHRRLTEAPSRASVAHHEARVGVTPRCGNDAPLSIGAEFEDEERPVAGRPFDGKIDSPRLLRRPLTEEERAALAGATTRQLTATNLSSPVASFVSDIVAAWDFSDGIEATHARDVSPNRHGGTTHNMPTRAMNRSSALFRAATAHIKDRQSWPCLLFLETTSSKRWRALMN